MTGVLAIIAGCALAALTVLTLSFFISSIWERERRASFASGVQFLITLGSCIVFLYLNLIGFFDAGIGLWILIAGLLGLIIVAALMFLPIGVNPKALEGTKGLIAGDVKRVDERDTVFSRIYQEKMGRVGENKGVQPEDPVLEEDTVYAFKGSANLAAAEAADSVTLQLNAPGVITPEVSEHKSEIDPVEAALRVKGFARNLGADLVGITEINPLWVYSYRGKSGARRNEWGKEIDLGHKYAIAFAMEMDIDLVGTAPRSPVIIETMRNYAKGAYIGAHLAAFIANLGYPAIVNQMAWYDTMMVPLAVDAGLGELSRMGYLISKEYGPRIRLGAVTTDFPMAVDKPVDIGVVDFCKKCLKCAHCCPSNSITIEDRKVVNGSLRWTIDTDSCHQYWRKVGTDCAICMRVCPWSHARTFPHRIITEAVCRSSISRTLFNWMDDIFYGKKPRMKDPPAWAVYESNESTDQPGSLIE